MQLAALVDMLELGIDWPTETEWDWLLKVLLDSAYVMEKTDWNVMCTLYHSNC
jgi:hypothetical protein